MPQTVFWSQNLPELQYGSSIELIGTSSSGLPVQFRVVTGEASYENGFLTPIGVGQLTIEAYQSGDEIFSVSNVVSKTFSVSKAPLIVRAGDVDRKVFLANPSFTSITIVSVLVTPSTILKSFLKPTLPLTPAHLSASTLYRSDPANPLNMNLATLKASSRSRPVTLRKSHSIRS